MFRMPGFAVAVAVLFAVSVVHSAGASVLYGPVTNPSNGHNYYLLNSTTWTASEAQAVSMGGHLATIRDAAEQIWVCNTFSYYGNIDRSLWIGLNDVQQEGTFVWASGQPVTYTNWAPGQPDNNPFYGGEDYVHMVQKGNVYGHPAGTWNDMDNYGSYGQFAPFHGVVEVVPEPATMAAVAFLLGLIRRW